jgi:hypothetical protein
LFIQWDWERADDADPHGLSREEITAALQQAGLSDVTVRPAFRVEVEGITMQPLEGFGWRPSGGAPSW